MEDEATAGAAVTQITAAATVAHTHARTHRQAAACDSCCTKNFTLPGDASAVSESIHTH